MATHWDANKSLITIGEETSYGTDAEAPNYKHADMFEFTLGVEQVDIPLKTQTLQPIESTQTSGRESPTVTLSGALTPDHEWLLQAYTGTASTPYVITTDDIAAGSSGHSYTIIQSKPEASDDLGEGIVATGCRIESLEITRDGQLISYTATFRAKQITYNSDLSGHDLTNTGTALPPTTDPFIWSECSSSIYEGTVTTINNFSFTFNNEFIDDDIAFGHNVAKTRDYVCKKTGEMTVEWLSDFDGMDDELVSNSDSEIFGTYSDTITLSDGTNNWAIFFTGQYTDYTRPDKENCYYTGSLTSMMCGGVLYGIVVTEPLSVSVS